MIYHPSHLRPLSGNKTTDLVHNKATSKYLQYYAETESQVLQSLTAVYDYVSVIPVCDENLDCLDVIFAEIKERSVLLIVVVNSPIENPCTTQWQQNNQKFMVALNQKATSSSTLNKHCQLLHFYDFNDVVLVDKNSDSQQINDEYGVGLARKIGCDIALHYFLQGNIRSPWLYSTDADVILPTNYFSLVIENSKHHSAVVLNFEHISDDNALNKLQFFYDLKLRYYHAGICYAGSQYDYIPLGSTLIVNMMAYAQVRGFPKKNAGEDFYLLNKLAKIEPVLFRQDIIVKIQSRLSNRVPFGTGPALLKINDLDSVDDYTYYNPQCFEYLKKWQQYLDSRYQDGLLKIKPPKDVILKELYQFFDCQKVFKKSVKQITNRQRWSQFILQWFDAFRTLKAVHFFDKLFPRMNYKQLLKSDNFVKVSTPSLQRFLHKND